MAVSSIGIDEPGVPDKFLHSNSRTISAVVREDQYILWGQNAYPTYTAIGSAVATTTSLSHLLFIQADGTLYTRLLRAWVVVAGDYPTAATDAQVQILRTSTAGSGGGVVTVGAMDSADTYAGTVQTLPSSKGTEGALLWQCRVPLPAAAPAVAPLPFYEAGPYGKPIVFGTGTGAGICFKLVTGIASAAVDVVAEFIQTTYL